MLPSSRQTLVLALVGSWLSGCGLTLTGTLDPIAEEVAEAAPLPDGSAPEASPSDEAGLVESGAAPDAADAAARPFCDPTDTTLVACFEFEGKIVDESSHAQHVDVLGPTIFVRGHQGKALLMDDLTRVHVPDNTAWKDGELSVEMWIYPVYLPDGTARAGLLDKDGAFGLFVHPDGTVSCTMNGAVEAVVAEVGVWSHVACVNDGTNIVLYADGVAKASTPAAGPVVTTGELAAIGGNSPDGEPFRGAIDDLRVFARARTPDEIAAAARR
jgi:hypothetical protein